jgi:peptidoglycan/LPS O-acetylase OafA/YrhL
VLPSDRIDPILIKKGRLPSLDGLRALSIMLVLGEHSTVTDRFPGSWDSAFKWLFDSTMGVRFFFCISGFIITYLLIGEYDRTGSIGLRRFYTRRAVRILPVYYVFLGTLASLAILTPWNQRAWAWFGNLTFTTNLFGVVRPSGHLWSLAVEEQFYLTWPGILALCISRQPRHRTAILLLGGMIALAPLARVSHVYFADTLGVLDRLVWQPSFFAKLARNDLRGADPTAAAY